MTPILEVRNLDIALPRGAGRNLAIDGLNLSVAKGEILCLVGESGSGKSMIAFSAMGLLPDGVHISAGEIRLNGENISAAPEARMRELRCKHIGMIFQEPMTALNPVMRCGDQIEEVLRFHTSLDRSSRRARVRAMIERVGLSDPARMLRAYPHQLSGGQRQRIMIAMALILEPKLLIADEPTTALDVTTQAQILQLIRDLQQEHQTGVLFITHDFGVVSEIADRVAVLNQGKLVELGDRDAVLETPRDPYTKMLISAVPDYRTTHRNRDPQAPVALRTENLGKQYGRRFFSQGDPVIAAQAVSLQVRRGETLGLVGESGSGKSTVARCVARLIDPTAGRILLGEQDISRLSERQLWPIRPKVQIIFQDPYRSLNPRQTVGASLIEGPLNYGVTRQKAIERITTLLQLVRVEVDALERYPHQFSGGQRQRLCIARALAMQPELLIADEAVSALDVSVQAQVLELFVSVRERFDLAMLFITHDLRVAATLCDDVAVMSAGQVVEFGAAGQVLENPQHPYSRKLFEAAPGRSFRPMTTHDRVRADHQIQPNIN